MQSARANFQKASGFPILETYINYSHGDEGPGVWYGEWNLPRLTALKEQWDPHNLFPGGHPVLAPCWDSKVVDNKSVCARWSVNLLSLVGVRGIN